MKWFHVHVGVENLDASVTFYTGLFGAEPDLAQRASASAAQAACCAPAVKTSCC